MSRPTPAIPVRAGSPLGGLAWVVLALAAGLTALWLWTCWCIFPSNPWNDIRVSGAIALHYGFSVYSTGEGVANTWAYGPLPLLVLWPAGLARDAAGALELAGAIHIAGRVIALVVVCLAWPVAAPQSTGTRVGQHRFATALVCVLLVRNDVAGYAIFTSDAMGLGAGLLGFLALVRGYPWLAAFGAVAAVACKQTMIGVGAAQVIWLFLAVSPAAAWRQIGRGAAVATLAALAFCSLFGAPALGHIIFEMAARYPRAPILERIISQLPYLSLFVAAPLAAMGIWRRYFFQRQSPVLLPAIAFLCTLPFSLAGFVTLGGSVNSLHSFWLWFPIVATVLATSRRAAAFGPTFRLALVALPALVASAWLQLSPLRLRPNVAHYHEAAELARQRPGQIWFPMNPVVTLYSDRRLYHDFDGLRVWGRTGFRPTDRNYFAHLPPHWNAMATLRPIGWNAAADDVRLPAVPQATTFGAWQVDLLPR